MPFTQLTYASRPFGFDAAMLSGILLDARRCNARDQITGLLICRADLYLQLLEGPEAAVDAAYRRIAADDRHMELRLLTRRLVQDRLFPAWVMRDDPARSWLWTKAEVDDGALVRATEDDVLAVFHRIADEGDQPSPP
jgi:Sensors of blue-light using FAD